jgi:hypothetical protein
MVRSGWKATLHKAYAYIYCEGIRVLEGGPLLAEVGHTTKVHITLSTRRTRCQESQVNEGQVATASVPIGSQSVVHQPLVSIHRYRGQ